MNNASGEAFGAEAAPCETCCALDASPIPSATVQSSEGRSNRLKVAPWWTNRQWQLLATCYSLLTVGLGIEYLLRLNTPANVAYVGSVVVGVYPSARDAWSALRRLQLTIGALVIVGAAGAIALGLWEEAAALIAVYSLGGILETRVLDRARKAMQEVRDLAPATALLVADGSE